tara:strand:+ start:19 stop:228 length:210 start_codon:yes stop_codon:yes gene_type:complete
MKKLKEIDAWYYNDRLIEWSKYNNRSNQWIADNLNISYVTVKNWFDKKYPIPLKYSDKIKDLFKIWGRR